MFNDIQLDMLARLYARILAWPEEDEEKKADCSAGSDPQLAISGDEKTAVSIVSESDASGEGTISQTE